MMPEYKILEINPSNEDRYILFVDFEATFGDTIETVKLKLFMSAQVDIVKIKNQETFTEVGEIRSLHLKHSGFSLLASSEDVVKITIKENKNNNTRTISFDKKIF
jgi:hypothetical protein